MRSMSNCRRKPSDRRTKAAAFFPLVALALSLLAAVDACKVVIVSPTAGSMREEGLAFSVSFRIRSSSTSPCEPAVAVAFSIDGNSVHSAAFESESFLPIAWTAPALECCQHVIELCVSNVPESCARVAVSISRSQQPLHWMPSTSGQAASNHFVAHSDVLADALTELLLPHDPLVDMSCDKYLLAHRGARPSQSGDAMVLSYDYSRTPLSQFEHCVSECPSFSISGFNFFCL